MCQRPPVSTRIDTLFPYTTLCLGCEESRLIGAMRATALARIEHPNYRLYVGTYPNDRATIDAVIEVARRDARVRLVIGPHPGPTTKADCLNALWRALLRDEADRKSVV